MNSQKWLDMVMVRAHSFPILKQRINKMAKDDEKDIRFINVHVLIHNKEPMNALFIGFDNNKKRFIPHLTERPINWSNRYSMFIDCNIVLQ